MPSEMPPFKKTHEIWIQIDDKNKQLLVTAPINTEQEKRLTLLYLAEAIKNVSMTTPLGLAPVPPGFDPKSNPS